MSVFDEDPKRAKPLTVVGGTEHEVTPEEDTAAAARAARDAETGRILRAALNIGTEEEEAEAFVGTLGGNLKFHNTSADPAIDSRMHGHAEALSHFFARYPDYLPEAVWQFYLPQLMERAQADEALRGQPQPVKKTAFGTPLLDSKLPLSGVGRYMYNALHYTFGLDGVREMRAVHAMPDRVFRPIVSSVYPSTDTTNRIIDVLTTSLYPSQDIKFGAEHGLWLEGDSVAVTPLQAFAHTAVFVADYMGDAHRAARRPHMDRAWSMAFGSTSRAVGILAPDRSLDGLKGRQNVYANELYSGS